MALDMYLSSGDAYRWNKLLYILYCSGPNKGKNNKYTESVGQFPVPVAQGIDCGSCSILPFGICNITVHYCSCYRVAVFSRPV